MRFIDRPVSTNIEDRRPKKTDKVRGVKQSYLIDTDGTERAILSQDEFTKLVAKYGGQYLPTEEGPSVRRYKGKNLSASDNKSLKAPEQPPPLPRKRPSQAYVEAPKPKERPRRYRSNPFQK